MNFDAMLKGMFARKLELSDRLIGLLPADASERVRDFRDGCISAFVEASAEFAKPKDAAADSKGARKVDIS